MKLCTFCAASFVSYALRPSASVRPLYGQQCALILSPLFTLVCPYPYLAIILTVEMPVHTLLVHLHNLHPHIALYKPWNPDVTPYAAAREHQRDRHKRQWGAWWRGHTNVARWALRDAALPVHAPDRRLPVCHAPACSGRGPGPPPGRRQAF